MTRKTRFIIASSLLSSGLFLGLSPVQASHRVAGGDAPQAPRWGDLDGETGIQAPRSAARVGEFRASHQGDLERQGRMSAPSETPIAPRLARRR